MILRLYKVSSSRLHRSHKFNVSPKTLVDSVETSGNVLVKPVISFYPKRKGVVNVKSLTDKVKR